MCPVPLFLARPAVRGKPDRLAFLHVGIMYRAVRGNKPIGPGLEHR